TYVPAEIPQALSRRIGSGSTELWTVRDAKHNLARQAEPEAYDKRLVDFFSQMNVNGSAKVPQVQRDCRPATMT
ncbi:MAG: hypothetical protein AB7O38_31705, partial [Pirellulaceae bacterium]